MIKNSLNQYEALKIRNAKVEELKDIETINVDTQRPVVERVLSLIEQLGNPYLFKVGNIPVKVSFNDKGLTLQQSLEKIFTQNS